VAREVSMCCDHSIPFLLADAEGRVIYTSASAASWLASAPSSVPGRSSCWIIIQNIG